MVESLSRERGEGFLQRFSKVVIRLALKRILREIDKAAETLEKISCLKEDKVGH